MRHCGDTAGMGGQGVSLFVFLFYFIFRQIDVVCMVFVLWLTGEYEDGVGRDARGRRIAVFGPTRSEVTEYTWTTLYIFIRKSIRCNCR